MTYSDETRAAVFAMIADGHTQKEAGERYGVGDATVGSWVAQERAAGREVVRKKARRHAAIETDDYGHVVQRRI